MSTGQILKSWFLTVAVGSLLSQILYIPVILLTNEKGWDYISGYFFMWIFVTLVASLTLSIPTILILIAVNENLKKKNVSIENSYNRLALIQLTCGLITFGLTFIGLSFDAWDYLLLMSVVFISTGLIILRIEMKKLATTLAIQNRAADA